MGLMFEKETPAVLGPLALVFLLSAAGVVADAALKVASEQTAAFANRYFSAGALIYASTAFFWVLAMKHLKLAVLGAFYSVSTALLLALVGVLFFKEALQPKEIVGIGLGVASLVLLTHSA
ncbi:MAG: SMR family transporter [Verrucomicrobiales bacterium]